MPPLDIAPESIVNPNLIPAPAPKYPGPWFNVTQFPTRTVWSKETGSEMVINSQDFDPKLHATEPPAPVAPPSGRAALNG